MTDGERMLEWMQDPNQPIPVEEMTKRTEAPIDPFGIEKLRGLDITNTSLRANHPPRQRIKPKVK